MLYLYQVIKTKSKVGNKWSQKRCHNSSENKYFWTFQMCRLVHIILCHFLRWGVIFSFDHYLYSIETCNLYRNVIKYVDASLRGGQCHRVKKTMFRNYANIFFLATSRHENKLGTIKCVCWWTSYEILGLLNAQNAKYANKISLKP